MFNRAVRGLLWCAVSSVWVWASSVAADPPDVLIADFESDEYGSWEVEGKAFGPGPAQGTLPGQMEVTGFIGRGLVNTFCGGDAMLQ